ncbi:hypothetical protein ACICHK_39495 [Streptomyces sp. AHU1]|uniref:hypothetical protein n=1 Tax=Streptomyces sp. AHU1 TaxID=3377215 RepID=UPI0038781709
MPASTTTRRAYREGRTRQEDQMSAQPDHAPVTPYAPAPGAPAELLAQLRADKRADTWAPAPTAYGYQWYRNGKAITGAIKSTYKLTTADRGRDITVKVTAKKTGCTSGTATSKAVRVS